MEFLCTLASLARTTLALPPCIRVQVECLRGTSERPDEDGWGENTPLFGPQSWS